MILLRKILEQTAPGTSRPGDSSNNLLRKILMALGGRFRFDDTDNNLLRKILTQLSSGVPDTNDFRPGDIDAVVLRKILKRIGGVFKPGDYETIILRKILELGFPQTATATDWKNRVVQAGGLVSDSVFAAHDAFSRSLSSAGLLPKIYRLNTFSGNGLTSALVPFINTLGAATDQNNGFVPGDWSQAGGLKGDGASKELRTGVLDNQVSISNLSLVFFGDEFEQTNTNHYAIGVLTAGNSASIFLSVRRTFTPAAPSYSCSQSNDAPLVRELPFSVGQSGGFISGSAIGLGPTVGYFNGEFDSQQPPGTTRIAPVSSVARDFYVFSRNFGAGVPFDGATSARGFGYGIFSGLTGDETRKLFQAMSVLFSSLNRI